jgi:integrase
VQDVNFELETVTFRPNSRRRLETKGSHRTIPLWPRLAEILRAYVKTTGRKMRLLFPSPRSKDAAMVTDFRKTLDAVAERTGLWKEGDVRTKSLRQTYCAARLQTLDGGSRSRLHGL